MKLSLVPFLALTLFTGAAWADSATRLWRTAPDEGLYLAPSAGPAFAQEPGDPGTTVVIDAGVRYQTMAGFGASMTEASAWALDQLNPDERDRALGLLFSRAGIGITLLRQPMGASDFALSVYSYDDRASGPDPSLEDFNLDRDRQHILPLLQRAKALAPDLVLMASPWSPPAWMKTGNSMLGASGGVLRPEYYAAYAEYFARFLEGYAAAGVPVTVVTPQNEPAYGPPDYPGMVWSAQEEGTFVRTALGPLLARRAPGVKILGWDHNWDKTQYAQDLLADPSTARWFAGTAWHHYGGGPEAMTALHNAFPDKEIWFTEGGSGRWIANNRYTGKFRAGLVEGIRIVQNWSKSIVWWNLALDQNHGPTVMPNNANDGLVAVDTRTGRLTEGSGGRFEAGYYALGHFSKFVRPGAQRIDLKADNGDLEAAAFLNPDGTKVVVAANRFSSSQTLRVKEGERWVDLEVPGDSGLTLVW